MRFEVQQMTGKNDSTRIAAAVGSVDPQAQVVVDPGGARDRGGLLALSGSVLGGVLRSGLRRGHQTPVRRNRLAVWPSGCARVRSFRG